MQAVLSHSLKSKLLLLHIHAALSLSLKIKRLLRLLHMQAARSLTLKLDEELLLLNMPAASLHPLLPLVPPILPKLLLQCRCK